MHRPESAAASQEDLVPLSALVQERRLADDAGRVLLALNLVLLARFIFVIFLAMPVHRDFFWDNRVQLPAVTQFLIGMPPLALGGIAAALAAGLIILDAVARSRRTRIKWNAMAMVLIVFASLFIDMALFMPMVHL